MYKLNDASTIEEYNVYVANNSGGFGLAIVRLARAWAELMEEALAGGKVLADCWEESLSKADTEGVTGFMCGCAQKELVLFWVHGEELRRLYNGRVTAKLLLQGGESGEEEL